MLLFRYVLKFAVLTLLVTNPIAIHAFEFEVSFPSGVEAGAVDGRVLLLIATSDETEPRFQVRPGVRAIQIFGIDVDDLEPGTAVRFDDSVFGYPIASLDDLPPGDYVVQAVLHRYETFHRADGHTVQLPMDRGEGQQWNRAPGNLYSTPRSITFDRGSDDKVVRISLDQAIPSIESPVDTEYVRHVRIQSELLTEFWGRPMFLGAHVLLPHGFDEHPDARYPLMIFHGHFPSDIGGFRTTPPDPDLECEYCGAVPRRVLQPHPTAGGLRLLPAVDRRRFPAFPGHRDPAPQPLLRRLLRGELGQPRPLRRRHHPRADPVHRTAVPRSRRGLGALSLRRLHRRLGGAGGPGLLPRRVQRRLRRVPRPDRLPSLHVGQHLRGRERLLLRGAVPPHRKARQP